MVGADFQKAVAVNLRQQTARLNFMIGMGNPVDGVAVNGDMSLAGREAHKRNLTLPKRGQRQFILIWPLETANAGDDVAKMVNVHHFAYETLVGKAKLRAGKGENGRQFSAYVWRQVAASGNMSGRRRKDVAAMKGMADRKPMIKRIFQRHRLIIRLHSCQSVTQDAVVRRGKLIAVGFDGNGQTRAAHARINHRAKGRSNRKIAIAVQQGKRAFADILRLNGMSDIDDPRIGANVEHDRLHHANIAVFKAKVGQHGDDI